MLSGRLFILPAGQEEDIKERVKATKRSLTRTLRLSLMGNECWTSLWRGGWHRQLPIYMKPLMAARFEYFMVVEGFQQVLPLREGRRMILKVWPFTIALHGCGELRKVSARV